jgi:hypothetical protein
MIREITCSNCDGTYLKLEAHSIRINGPETARYVCPKCHRGTVAAPPQQPPGPDLPGIDHIDHIWEADESPLDTSTEPSESLRSSETLATCWFTNDAQLRFRETDDGWIREEVVFPDGKVHESRAIGRLDPDDGQTACHCLVRKLAKYETYSVSMLRRNWPHVASVVLDP